MIQEGQDRDRDNPDREERSVGLSPSRHRLTSAFTRRCGPQAGFRVNHRVPLSSTLARAGAACVLLGQFNSTHVDALRQFCRDCTETDVRRNTRRYSVSSALLQSAETAVRNARLGALFVWTGCISAALWMCAFLLEVLTFES